jgi:hypothetical protein
MRAALLVLPLVLLLGAGAAHADLGLNIYGFSYHFDRDKAKELGLTHEFNPGIGIRWRRADSGVFADAAVYSDSAANTAVVAGAGYLWRAGESLRLGGALALFRSDTYNKGDAFIAPIPLAAYEYRRVTFNLAYFPKWRDTNLTNQVGAWITVWF